MSTTGNESEHPNEESADVLADGPDHHGRDGGRDTLTVGEAQRAQSGEQTQDAPAMSQNNATDDAKIDGIVAQTRVDVAHLGKERVEQVLRQRFEQTGVDVADDDIDGLARRVLEG